MPQVNYVQKSRKDQGTCGSCQTPLTKGSAYRWWKFRYGGKYVRCLSDKCAPRSSDLTSSDKLSRVYAAQENACDVLSEWDGKEVDDLTSIVETMVSELEEVSQEYQASADAIRENFEESPTADECEEKSGEIDDWISDIEGVDLDEFEYDEDDATPREKQRKKWEDDIRGELENAVNNCPL